MSFDGFMLKYVYLFQLQKNKTNFFFYRVVLNGRVLFNTLFFIISAARKHIESRKHGQFLFDICFFILRIKIIKYSTKRASEKHAFPG